MTEPEKVDLVGVGLNATDTLISLGAYPARGSKTEYSNASVLPVLNRYSFFRRAAFALLSMPLLASLAFAQITNVTNDTSTPIPGAGHDYVKLLSQTVNPANGSVRPFVFRYLFRKAGESQYPSPSHTTRTACSISQ